LATRKSFSLKLHWQPKSHAQAATHHILGRNAATLRFDQLAGNGEA
jgi:hypothetical protein